MGVFGATPSASVILVTYERLEATARCLERLMATVDGDVEIVVVDNGSRDAVQDLVRHVPGIQIFLPRNRGLYKALNIGVSVTRAPHIAFLDADVVVSEGWLEALIAELEASDRHGLTGSRYLNADGSLQEGLPRLREDGWYGENRRDPGQPESCQYIAIGCSAWRREAWDRVGGFDEGYFISHGDIDFCYKLRYEGNYHVRYCPGSTVIHDHEYGREQAYEAVRFDEATCDRDFARFRRKWIARYQAEADRP